MGEGGGDNDNGLFESPVLSSLITDSSRLSYIGRSNKKIEAHLLGMQLQIGYLRSLEDSERVRAACLNHLQTWFIQFYPERIALVKQLEQLAATLGGRLTVPRLSWKYIWIQKLFGWMVTKRPGNTTTKANRL
jgi:hypothetical protein